MGVRKFYAYTPGKSEVGFRSSAPRYVPASHTGRTIIFVDRLHESAVCLPTRDGEAGPGETHERGLPLLRPLVLEFPADPIAAQIDDAYLLVADLLVSPIFSESREPVARRLYLVLAT